MADKRTEPQEDKQLKFFDNLVDNGGNVAQAAEAAGYTLSYAYQLAKKYKEYLLDRVQGKIILHSVKAAKVLTDGLSDDGTEANTKLRIDVAKDILDRSGIVKTEKSELKVDSPNGIFILPAKAGVPNDDKNS